MTWRSLRWLVLLPIPVVWMLLEHYDQLTFLEERSVDWRFRYRREIESPVKLVYLNVDSLSQNRIGNHPWSRDLYSRVANALVNEAKVKAVAFDFVFSDAGISQSADRQKIDRGNREFRGFLGNNPPVVLAAAYAGWQYIDIRGEKKERRIRIVSDSEDTRTPEQVEPPEIPYFLIRNASGITYDSPGGNVGLIDTIRNGTRMVPAWAPNNTGRVYYHMAVELARIYWGLPVDGLRVRNGTLEFVRADGTLQSSLPMVDGQLLEVNWFNHWEPPPGVSKLESRPAHLEFVEVLQLAVYLESKDAKKVQEAKEFFSDPGLRDAIVLVGPVDPLLQDRAPTSFDDNPVPKVGVHGNLLNTIVSGKLLKRPTEWQNQAILLALTVIVLVLSVAGGARASFAKTMAVLTLALYVAATLWYFEQLHLVLPFVAPLGAAFTTGFGGLIIQVIDEQKAKSRIKGMFSAYLAPTVVNSLIESGKEPELGGHEAEITAYFSDIQSFSSFSEKMTPARLVELMNEYLTACTDIVQEEGGTLDKYIGDAVVAMYGAPLPLPDHAHRAVLATIRVQKRIEELRQKWRSEGDAWPLVVHNLRARLGLNSGPAIIGNMGSRTRFSYTMMGDNVNLAARMESGAKSLGVYTMITGTTREACEKHSGDTIVFRFLDKLVVKGRSLPVTVHEVVGLRADLSQQSMDCLGLHAEGMQRYLAQNWDGAIELFQRSAALEPFQKNKDMAIESNASLIMLERCAYMKEHPPGASWDGVNVMKEK